jgi:hypothetical protein
MLRGIIMRKESFGFTSHVGEARGPETAVRPIP